MNVEDEAQVRRSSTVGARGSARASMNTHEHHAMACKFEQLDGDVVQLVVRRQLLDGELDLPLRKRSREW